MTIVNCTNKALVAFFLQNGIKPVDIFLGRNDTIVFSYDAEVSKQYYDKWMSKNKEED